MEKDLSEEFWIIFWIKRVRSRPPSFWPLYWFYVGFGSGSAAGVGLSEKLPLCLMEQVPGGSEVDLPMAKAEPIRDGGSTSEITYSRRGIKLCNSNSSPREE